MPDDQTELIEALESPQCYPHAAASIERLETHISWVFLTGPFAYKIKKSVRLPFVDFSTLPLRERFCRDELLLNRRLAPELYLDVVPIGRSADGFRIGATPAVEFAVKMRQFAPEQTADRLVESGALEAGEIADLGRRIASFHASLRPVSAALPEREIFENLDELEDLVDAKTKARLDSLGRRFKRRVAELRAICRERNESGFVRECHGDLHLGNVARVGDRLLPFDCLEFDHDLRTIDIVDEVAFLFMDLGAHGRGDLATTFVNAWLEATGDYAGLRLLRLYAAHRALVRAKVAGLRQAAAEDASLRTMRAYLDAAGLQIEPARPLLLITRGLSGSGKTTIARQLAPMLEAIHVRSDIERKRLHGLEALERTESAIDSDLYRPAVSDETYARLLEIAETALAGGLSVLVDATFLTCERRDRFRAAADRSGAGFAILDCKAAAATLSARVVERERDRKDASEAGLEVLEHQLASAEPITRAERRFVLEIDTESAIDIAALAAAVARQAGSATT